MSLTGVLEVIFEVEEGEEEEKDKNQGGFKEVV